MSSPGRDKNLRYGATQQRIARASSHMKPLDWSARLGIRRQDIPVFKAAARGFDHTIIVRATNERSLQFIGRKGYRPKPIDCKPKTADAPSYVAREELRVQCAGLVVDPTVVGNAAFASDPKRNAAIDAWKQFLKDKSRDEIARKVFRRRGTSRGYFAVDLEPRSAHFGCLMFSDNAMPEEALDERVPRWKVIRPRGLDYIHADYDLYGLLDMRRTVSALGGAGGEEGFRKRIVRGELYGVPHHYSESFPTIQEFLNRGLGCAMIQHGSQDNVGHRDDALYVFDPIGGSYYVEASADAIREIYSQIFKQAREASPG